MFIKRENTPTVEQREFFWNREHTEILILGMLEKGGIGFEGAEALDLVTDVELHGISIGGIDFNERRITA